jgi:AcrR family transcriptional regulator
VTTQKATDRRVARTRRLLRDALHSLIREKNYDEIVVKEIIDRADVGRSAFYTHFRDKDDLLASSIEDLLADVPVIKSANPENTMEALLWFSLPIFEHIEGQHAHGGLRMGQKGRSVLHQRLKLTLAKLISARLKKNPALLRTERLIPADLIAGYLAATFVLVLDWWVDSKARLSPQAANELFLALAAPALRTAAARQQ